MPSFEVRASCSVSSQQDRFATVVVEAATEEEARMLAVEQIEKMDEAVAWEDRGPARTVLDFFAIDQVEKLSEEDEPE
jgi:hypothetical protein